jgi:thiol-disulfide isomerase/thioredoxin
MIKRIALFAAIVVLPGTHTTFGWASGQGSNTAVSNVEDESVRVDFMLEARSEAFGSSHKPASPRDLADLSRASVVFPAGTLVGKIDQSMDGQVQYMVSFATGERGWFRSSLFERSDSWIVSAGALVEVQSSDCWRVSGAKAKSIALDGRGRVWVWAEGKPCLTRVEQTDISLAKPEIVRHPTPLIPGSMVEVACPSERLVAADGHRSMPAVGRAEIQRFSPSGVAIAMGQYKGVVPVKCGRPNPLIGTNFLRGIQLPEAAERKYPVLLHFWATWCKPCIEELPRYAEFVDLIGPERSLAISEDFSEMDALRYLAGAQMYFPSTRDTQNQAILRRYTASEALPFTVVVFPDGAMEQYVGKIDWSRSGEIYRKMRPDQ